MGSFQRKWESGFWECSGALLSMLIYFSIFLCNHLPTSIRKLRVVGCMFVLNRFYNFQLINEIY